MPRAARPLASLLILLVVLPLPGPVAAADPTARAGGEPEPATSDHAGAYASDRVIVGWRNPAAAGSVASAHGLAHAKGLATAAAVGAPGVLTTNGRTVESVLAELRSDPNVLYAEPDYVISVDVGSSATPVSTDDPLLSQQYSLNRMQVRHAWSVTTGAGNVIAVLDTGVQFSHPDLTGRLLPGYDFVNDDATASDDNGHGTWVSGIIAARANDGWGIAGITWSDKILPVKIMDANGSGYTSTLVEGLYWAADHGAKVINMSIGGFPASTSVQNAVNYAWNKGVVLVGAAGNNRREETHFPASFDHVISVSATQADDEFTNWSSYGPKVDLSAPGGSVLTTNCQKSRSSKCMYYGEHIVISGTSFATPNTAGVVALLWAQHPDWTPQQIASRLIGTVDDLGYAGWDKYYGYGRVNAYRALGGSPAAAIIPSVDSFEPNYSLATAPKIPRGTTLAVTNYPAGDKDYFTVRVPRAGRLDVRVTAVTDTVRPIKSALPVDPIVELLTTSGSRLALVDNPSNSAATELASVAFSGATNVVVKVSNWFPNGSTVPYTVRAVFVDTVGPKVVAHTPASDEKLVDRLVTASVTFNESVKNVSAQTITLHNEASGRVVPATVTYDAATRTARLSLSKPLAARKVYRVTVTTGVTDTAGNPVAPVSWTFRSGKIATYQPPAQLAFEGGTFTGYRFDADGEVTGTRTYTLGRKSGANAALFGKLPGQSGDWYYVANGVWAGYWVRRSAGTYLAEGNAPKTPSSNAIFDPRVSLVLRKGTHTGYRFDASGHPTAQHTATLPSNAVADTSQLRTVTNQYGRWYRIVSGTWAGYWMPASDVVYLAPG